MRSHPGTGRRQGLGQSGSACLGTRENKLRQRAQLPPSVKGSTDVFKMALAQDKFALGGQQTEQQDGSNWE